MGRLFLLWMAWAGCGLAQPGQVELFEQKTLARIREFDAKRDGVLGVAAVDLSTGRAFSYHGDTLFATASSIKIPILIELFKAERAGQLRFSDTVTLRKEDAVGGTGHLRGLLDKGPMTLTVRELMTAMIETSDNTATNQCIKLVTMAKVNRTLDEMGFLHTRLRRIMLDTGAARRDEENVSTPNEMVRLVERIYRETVVDAAACRDMLGIMKRVKAEFRKAIPPEVEVASKPGSLNGVSCETGIVYLKNRPFALSVMTGFLPGEDGASDAVSSVARMVYQHFERLARSNRFGNRTE